MSDEKDHKKTRGTSIFSGLSSNQFGGFGGGGAMSEERPLDALLPGLGGSSTAPGARKSEPIEAQPIHLRLLEVELEDHWEWLIACWSDPGAAQLKRDLDRFIRATLLREMIRPFGQIDPRRNFRALRLVVFAELSPQSRAALKQMHFIEESYDAEQYRERMAALRREGGAADVKVNTRPQAVFALPIVRPEPAIDDKLQAVQRDMLQKLRQDYWGQTPGGPSRLMAMSFYQHFGVKINPSRDGLHALELFLVQEEPAQIRWMAPALFQGLCDFVGVILQVVYGFEVQWADCKPSQSAAGMLPTFRLANLKDTPIIPIAKYLLDWCLLPRSGESPSLSEHVAAIAARS